MFRNVYEDPERAASYAQLDFPGTYFLAYRDLPEIIRRHVTGGTALDFGCGTGRSTRFLQGQGFRTVGIDIAEAMVKLAQEADPAGDYRVVSDEETGLEAGTFDLVFSSFAFDNIPDADNRGHILSGLARLLTDEGRVVILGSTPEIYLHEWASFSTDFEQNRTARSGDQVLTVMKDVPDSRPVVDILWTHEDYLHLFDSAGLEMEARYLPLGRDGEGYDWVNETTVAPWVIYVTKLQSATAQS